MNKYSSLDDASQGAVTRRNFLKWSTLASAATVVAPFPHHTAYAAGSDTLRVGLIGSGGRGTKAAAQCVTCAPGMELTAVGDLVQDRLDSSLKKLRKQIPPEKFKVTPETCFTGFDNYKKVIDADVDLVILTAPPHFRPQHFQAAVEAGKHVFMEKPVAVDPVGVKSIIASSDVAEQKGLGVVAGTQRRHQQIYIDIMNRIHDGAIGDILSAQCYWMGGTLWHHARKPEWSDMEFQCRNWLYFSWLSGDQPVEQHMHNLDVVNWGLQAHPHECMGTGGRLVRTDPKFGDVFDHFAVDYEYPNGVHVTSMCRQMKGCTRRVSERFVGTEGVAFLGGSNGWIKGKVEFKPERSNDPYVQEHEDLIASIRDGQPLNEGKRVAESTMTAVIGRMSAYTGRALKWDWAMNASTLDLSPPAYEFGDLPEPVVAVPGETPLA